MATPDYDQVLKNNQEAASLSAKAAQEARDAYTQIINTKVVGINGQLRALSAADTLADAPVGDAARVRSNIGAVAPSDLNLGALSAIDILSDARVGDAAKLRSNIGAVTKSDLDLGSIATKDAKGWASTEAELTNDTMGRMATGIYRYVPESNPPKEDRVAKYGNMLVIQDDYPDWRSKLFFPAGSGRIFYLHYAGGSENPWKPLGEVMMTGINCTIDSNGFLKASSPIMRIGSQQNITTGHNFVSAGHGSVNSEAQGSTCERLSEGVYKISGSLGFADDGVWTIETPKDENGQALLWVNTKQEADGTIMVETYHRTHPGAPVFARNNVEGKNDGDPIDIPAGRWIDLRLKMPEKKKPQE